MADGPIGSVTIHAVYLINPATKDKEMPAQVRHLAGPRAADGRRDKGRRRGLHPGSTVGEPLEEALPRGQASCSGTSSPSPSPAAAAREHGGRGTTLGRSFEELAELVDLSGGDERIGVCLDSCHLLATGFDLTGIAGKLTEVVDSCTKLIGRAPAALPA